MTRDFSELARFWVETYGKDITRLPRGKMVEIANQCINADIVHSMEPVRPEEGMYLAAAVEIALDDDSRAKAKADAAMPKLTGTNKQILWAELIRRDAIAAARLLRQRVMQRMDELTVLRLDAFVTLVLRKESDAKWFIDNRNDFAEFPMINKGEPLSSLPKKTVPIGKAEEDARNEMTLHSKNDRHMGVAEITTSGNGLLAVFTRDTDFAKMVGNQRLNWDPDVQGWRQKKDGHGKHDTDQIVKLAAALLAEGFSVMVSDDEARKRAQEETNEPNRVDDSTAMTDD